MVASSTAFRNEPLSMAACLGRSRADRRISIGLRVVVGCVCGRLVSFIDNLVVVVGILKECRRSPPFGGWPEAFSQGSAFHSSGQVYLAGVCGRSEKRYCPEESARLPAVIRGFESSQSRGDSSSVQFSRKGVLDCERSIRVVKLLRAHGGCLGIRRL